MPTSRQWLLNGHPRGRGIEDGDFRLVETRIAAPGDGDLLLKTLYLGFDPAQKGWMENIADYVAPMAIGDVMRGSGISEVAESNHPGFAVGDLVMGSTGWTEWHVSNGAGLVKIDTALPPTAMLSVLGTTGVTAYCGLFKVGRPVAGDTVLVSGAAGATGSIVGQLAKIAGCRVVGIAGGEDKCRWLVEEAGYDAAIDYKAGNVRAQIKDQCPRGVDVIFDNVGGAILNDMLGEIATGARIAICGGISRYETGSLPAGPQNYFNLVFRRGTMAGFIVLDWAAEFPAIRKRLEGFVQDGRLTYREDVQVGFENAPATLKRLFSGQNRGKQLLKL
ncbi:MULTISPECIES: NADP-dependent oxidoreductase [unclassified Sphingopyxis]|jgi:NADPH-dependent curcumin reductase CurA|uniref:NADP-dependent oxidoreductase n=1 Tax=unclassified Sphingopyxis TaxID=2614943 RepID=UPI00285460AD|nr:MULTISPECIES: NADP-dependent oxidoreductase [unclassified Sphingopyxis]MDR6833437.1 NADPH-dependent curcumin reductase CurA [Sphingopyxis sp. BE122]MDR7225706.1 NADPH-dependent curcumin reductase CurA [Sphingopyxis sp. BE259]